MSLFPVFNVTRGPVSQGRTRAQYYRDVLMIPTGAASLHLLCSGVRGWRSERAAALQLLEIQRLVLADISRVDLCREYFHTHNHLQLCVFAERPHPLSFKL